MMIPVNWHLYRYVESQGGDEGKIPVLCLWGVYRGAWEGEENGRWKKMHRIDLIMG